MRIFTACVTDRHDEEPVETFVLSPVLVDLVVTVGGRWLLPLELRVVQPLQEQPIGASRKKKKEKIVQQ